METVKIDLTGTSYVLVGSKGAWGSMQNVGATDVAFVLGTSLPADSTIGFILKPLDGASPSTFGNENVYAKGKKGSGQIVILK